MSTSEQENLDSADGEELVAYLDGELPANESRRIEERLAADSDYRDQLRELDRAWEALDALPRPNAPDDFARTTIELVAIEAQGDLAKKTVAATKSLRARRIRWAAVALLAAAAGFAGATAFVPNGDTELIEDLPVIRQVDLLTHISDAEFLRELSQREWVDQLPRDQKGLREELDAINKASAPSQEDRRAWVESLSADEKQRLYARSERFKDTTDKERQRLRDLSQEIAADQKVEKLRETLVAYGQWLTDKRENLKFELRNRQAPASMRLTRIEQLVKDEGRRLSEDERRKLRAEIRAITLESKDAMFAAAAQRQSEDIAELRKRIEAQPTSLELCTVMWALNNVDTREKTRQRLIDQLDADTRADLAERDAQSNAGQRGGAGGNFGGPPRDQLVNWIFNQVQPRRNYSPQDLMNYFENLNDETKRDMAEVPRADFETVLAQRYEAERMVNPRDFETLTGSRMPPGRGGGGGGRGDGPPRGGGGRRGPGQDGGLPFGFESEFRGRGGNRRGEGDEEFRPGSTRGERRPRGEPQFGDPGPEGRRGRGEPPAEKFDPSK